MGCGEPSNTLEKWKSYQATPWGRLLHSVVQTHLARHLPQAPPCLRILDAGGGDGVTAVSCARRGHSVALVDLSSDLLNEAKQNAREAGLFEHLTFHHANLLDIPVLFSEPTFDVVLCHNVIGYVDDLSAALQAICHPLHPGGWVSVISMSRYSEPYREALQQLNPAAAREKLGVDTYRSGVFDCAIRLYAPNEVIGLLEQMGCSLVQQYGVRCVNDYMSDNEIKLDPAFWAELEKLEIEFSDRYPYYLLARYFHLIARKAQP